LCDSGFYNDAKDNAQVTWSRLVEDIDNKLNEDNTRMLHAKLFILEDTQGDKWAFAGSVNFSHKAFHENFEAGFMFRLDEKIKLLELLTEDPDGFDEKQMLPEQPPKDTTDKAEECAPSLLFDWKNTDQNKKLLFIHPRLEKEAKLMSQDGQVLLEIRPSISDYKVEESSELVKHLERNGFVVYDDGACRKNVYVLQKNWIYKPLYYPDLNPKEILDIYISMDMEKRDRYILGAVIRDLVRKDEITEYTHNIDEIRQSPDFFSAYAELFYAFRHLVDRFCIDEQQKDYYLFSPKPDSLPSLIKQTTEDEQLDNVMKYLIFLSCKELYRRCDIDFSKYERNLDIIRNLFDDKDFIEWFESEFGKEYRLKEVNDE